MRFIVLFIACAGIVYCAQPDNTSHQSIKFTGNTIRINFDSTLYAIAYNNGYIIGAQNNGKLLILDSNYQRQAALETRLYKDSIGSLLNFHDTVFIAAGDTRYYLDTSMNWQVYKGPAKVSDRLLWDDDSWHISECCMGEFGGAVFFFNKKTNKTWSFPATCASQVMKYKNGYWICNNLAHLTRHASYTLVPDPEKTFDLSDTTLKNRCNWWTTVDSLQNDEAWKSASARGIKRIAAPEFSMTAQAFMYRDSLYAVLSNDKYTYIAMLQQDSMVVKDTIFKHPINFHHTQTIQAGKKTISLLNLTGGSAVEAYFFTGNSSAIMVTNGTKIDLLLKKLKSNQ